MILTKAMKTKLAQGEVYPVSHRTLSEVLADIPQAEVELSYSDYQMSERRFQKTKMGESNQRVFQDYNESIIRAGHSRTALTTREQVASEDQPPEDVWTISVHSIPTHNLAAFRACLENDGYAKLKNWFIETSKQRGAIGIHSFTIGFDGKQLKYKYFSKF